MTNGKSIIQNWKGNNMIIINFCFRGKKVKLTKEGNTAKKFHYKGNKKFQKIQNMHNSILNKESKKFKDVYTWCQYHALNKNKKGRSTFFAF